MKAAGLDVDGANLRAVVLEGTSRSARVVHAQEAPGPAGAPGDGDSRVVTAEALAPLRKALQEETVAGINAQALFLREVSLPFVPENQIPEVLPFEVEAFLPCPAEEIVLSWLPLEAPAGAETSVARNAVLAVAIQKARLAGLLETLGRAGVDPVSLTADLFALPEAWPEVASEEPLLFVDLDDAKAAVVGWHAGRIRFARLLPLGAGSSAADLASDIVRTLLSVDWKGKAAALCLSGGRTLEPGFAEALSAAVGIPVRLWEGPEFEGKPLGPQFAVAYGLARRGLGSRVCDLELRSGPFRSRNRWERLRGAFLALAACAVAALGIVTYGAWDRFRTARSEVYRVAEWQERTFRETLPEAADLPPEEALGFLRQKEAEFKAGPLGAGREGGGFFSAWDLFLELIRCLPLGMPSPRLEDALVGQRDVTFRGAVRDAGGKTGADWAYELEGACNGSKWFAVQKAIEVKPPAGGETPFELRLSVKGRLARE